MTGARWRKVRADLGSNRARSLLTIVSLAVGTLAVGAMHLASVTVESSFESSFRGANPPSSMLHTSPFPADLVEDVLAHPMVDEAEGRRLLQTRAVDAEGDSVLIELVAMPDLTENHVALIESERGTWPPQPGEVVVERASLAEIALDIGDVMAIEHPGRPAVDLRVVGSAFDVYEMAPTLGGPVRAYVSMETINQLTGSELLDTLYLRAVGDPLDRDVAVAMTGAVRDEVLAPAEVAIERAAIQDPSEHRADNAVSFLVLTMQILSLLAMVIAVALVINTVGAVLAQQRRQVGVMKAVGATSSQLALQYLGYVLLLSLAALVVAVPAALLIGRFLAGFLADLANFELEPVGIPWSTLAIQVAVGVLLPIAAVVVAVRRASRLSVHDAVSDRGITDDGRPPVIALPVRRPTLLAYRNAVRNRSRLALTVVAIAVCGAVLVGVLHTQQALGNLTDQMAGYWDYDIEFALTEPVAAQDVVAVIGDDEAVESAESWFKGEAFRIRPDGTENEVSITGSPRGSDSLDPTLLEGRWFEADDNRPIVINTHFADDEPDVDLGSEIMLDVEGHRQTWTVVGVASTTLVGPVAYLPADDLVESIDRLGQTNLVAVQLDPRTDPATVSDRLEIAGREAGLPVGEVRTHAELQAEVNDLVTVVVALLLLVGAVLAFVAVVGVAGTMTLNVIEQTREIGVLRTLGASNWAVRRLFLLQGLAVAALGGALGVILAVPVAMMLRASISSGLIDAALPTGFSSFGVAVWLVVAAFIGALGATRPARVAARLSIRDTLTYE